MSINNTLSRFVDLLPLTEGSDAEYYTDSQGYRTAPYGVLADPAKSSAYKRNKQVASSLGYDIDSLTTAQAREVAIKLAEDLNSELSKAVPGYDDLPTEYQVFMLDAKFNTGDTYKNFAKKAAAYEASGSEKDFKALIAESTRKEGGKRTEGMDNRSAKVLLATGIAPSLESLQRAGLTKASEKAAVPDEYYQNYEDPAQMAASTEDGVFTGDEFNFFIDDLDSLISSLELEAGIAEDPAQMATEQELMEEELLRAVEAEMSQMEMTAEPEMTESTLPPSMQVVPAYSDFDTEFNEQFYDTGEWLF